MSTGEEIHIRKMKDSDISSITSLDKRISGSSRPEMWRSEIQHYLKNNSICLVAEIQGQVVGFMIGTVHPWLFGIENGGWIEILGVDPSHTAKGVGKKLGEKLLEEFKLQKVKTVYTSVKWTSSDLLEFFRTLEMTKSSFITLKKEL
ncbi:MAG: GNAT family N-acetyltransferase [Candidatus Hermodarchaeota archaeon]